MVCSERAVKHIRDTKKYNSKYDVLSEYFHASKENKIVSKFPAIQTPTVDEAVGSPGRFPPFRAADFPTEARDSEGAPLGQPCVPLMNR